MLETNILYITAILKLVLIVVLFLIFKIYLDSYKKIKITYTIGLIVFISIFIVKTIGSLFFTISLLTPQPDPQMHHDFYKDLQESVIELIAMIVLYYITRK